ncbi:EutP/PduV family microcompartment system protein [Clostridium tarantellae]|uniref:EutP/PduV family microcompartment system protein n=1 Tax=Clostridium tarantellae TaxID=39493 RepID=A0A6I1MRJ9_9CLOT|nr:EutP/PduV family microcompartment system protein [Clostridium tarantellae]MPQ42909.1 EutP/PduV family microcompartment system protein [Clostridium tarantellae]
MSRVIFIGKTGCGKTTLCQKLNELEFEYKKTQAVELYDNAIDTPGEYMENRNYYNALIVTAADADVIALVYDCTSEEGYIPPAFASIFPKEVIGIITKISLAKNKEHIEIAKDKLEIAGVGRIFKVDTIQNIGIDKLLKYLNQF